MNKIILTQKEIEIIESQINGTFNIWNASEEDRCILNNITKRADDLLRELDAYDELEGDLIEWYYNKYKEQK